LDTQDAKQEAILQARDYIDAENAVMAVDALKRFLNSVEGRQSGNGEILQKEEAADLTAAARRIIDLLDNE